MKSGIIGKINGDFGTLDSFEETIQDRGFDVTTCLDVRHGHMDLMNGVIGRSGRVLEQEVTEVEDIQVVDGTIEIGSKLDTVSSFTEFLVVPDSGFLLVENKEGEFAFDILAEVSNTEIVSAEIDLDEYASVRSRANPWKCGFYRDSGNAENGIVHGQNVLDDPEMGNVLTQSNKNQLGLEFNYKGMNLKMEATSSGYVRAHRPTNFTSENFLQFIRDDLVNHIR